MSAGRMVLVHRKDREAILKVGGPREMTAREQAEESLLDRDLEGSPLKGKPLRSRLRNFRPGVDGYVVSLGGPLPYMRRLRQIELEIEQHQRRLDDAWRGLADDWRSSPAEFARLWRRIAERWSFGAVNDLIDGHNRWYPAEARLAMNPRSGDYVLVGGKPYRREPLGADWILARYPAELDRAVQAA